MTITNARFVWPIGNDIVLIPRTPAITAWIGRRPSYARRTTRCSTPTWPQLLLCTAMAMCWCWSEDD
ncbi:hypothetical protein J3R03_003503 [Actinoplanes couchii]|uniref:Uncharacterized protein n=1 Tax=Actinoplanes couchii TaxID=403638 RepID=A0ABQ3XLU4_9ACTN|nr:hypothetical protein [Actinoplanes couchii]GID59485.1 hypothetical protein Aco03nite_078890 [Actinoplanes couchii]